MLGPSLVTLFWEGQGGECGLAGDLGFQQLRPDPVSLSDPPPPPCLQRIDRDVNSAIVPPCSPPRWPGTHPETVHKPPTKRFPLQESLGFPYSLPWCLVTATEN